MLAHHALIRTSSDQDDWAQVPPRTKRNSNVRAAAGCAEMLEYLGGVQPDSTSAPSSKLKHQYATTATAREYLFVPPLVLHCFNMFYLNLGFDAGRRPTKSWTCSSVDEGGSTDEQSRRQRTSLFIPKAIFKGSSVLKRACMSSALRLALHQMDNLLEVFREMKTSQTP